MKEKSFVVITEAPKMAYLQDYTVLPRNYGSSAHFNRTDV